MKRLMVLSVVASVTMSAWCADTWYVKPDGTDAEDRGKSAETPFRTLQYAHDNAAAGDTIRLLPGTYAEGEVADPKHKNRLVVSKKLFFRATGKKSETIIRGRFDPSTGSWGANAIRCVYVAKDGYDSEFHGITFKEGGGTCNSSDGAGSSDWGGCVHVYGPKQDSVTKEADIYRAFFVDCDFIDGKSQWGGGLNGGTAIRCYFSGCQGSSFGATASRSALWNCVIVNGKGGDDRPQVGNYSLVVNCVVYGCERTGFDRACNVYNTYCANMSQSEFRQQYSSYPVVYDHSVCGTGAENRTSGTEPGQYLLFSPATGDYRPIAGTALIGGGLTSYMTDIIRLPEDMAWKDFNGNAINTNLVACDIGAVQGGVTLLAGKIVFPAAVTVAGHYNLRSTYSFAESFPSFVFYKTDNAKYFCSRLSGFTGGTEYRYAERDGRIWFCYPPCVGDTMTVTEDNLGGELWTDPKADAATADGSEAHPFRTIQAAMKHIENKSLANVIVHALPGEYAEGETFYRDATNRVVMPNVAIILRSTDGAAVTTIRGAAAPLADQPYPDGYPGCGDGAIRCISFAGYARRMIDGFTLADGHSRVVNYGQDLASDRGGAIDCNSETAIQVVDCVITNCISVRAAMYCGWYRRCKFYDCQGYGGLFRYANVTASYIDPSCKIGKGVPGASAFEIIGPGTRTYHVTCPVGGLANINDSPRFLVNSLFGTAVLTTERGSETEYRYWGSVLASDSWSLNYSCDHAFMSFANLESGDCRLIGNTPATHAGRFPVRGTAEWGLWATNYAGRITLDIDGNPIHINPNGNPMAGCWQTVADGIWIDTPAKGGLATSSGHLGANLVPPSGTLTLSFTKDATRPLSDYVVNGITNPVPLSCALILSAADVAGGLYLSDCVYSPHWYVDAENGDDANSGFISGAAKKTLKAVLGDARVASGDTVHAAEGTYATDPMACEISSANTDMKPDSPVKKLNMYVRAIVPAGVTLQADGRVEKTVIVGARDETAASDRYFLGSNAVHCVYLKGSGATICGFTVTGGGTDWYDTAIYANDWVRPIGGGGILSYEPGRYDTYAYDCIISNNWGYTATGLRFLNAIRCVVTENHAVEAGGAGREFNAVGSVFDRNYQGSAAGVFDFARLDSCTFGPNDRNLSDTSSVPAIDYGVSGSAYITNCLVLGSCGGPGAMTAKVFNSVFAKGCGTLPCHESCYIGDGTDVLVDADLRPIPGKNPAVDRGDRTNTHALLPLDLDALGGQRIMNGEIDVGALEADWRPVYARDISRSGRFAVTEVGEDIVETDSGTVAIPDGETLAAIWRNRDGKTSTYNLSVRLAEAGTLTILLNGEPFREVSSVGTTELRFDGPLAENRLDFAYAGNGSAEIVSSRCECGQLLFVR